MKTYNFEVKKGNHKGWAVAFAGLFASALLHASIIGGIAYASGFLSMPAKLLPKTQQSPDGRYALLPDVEIISNVSSLKHNEKNDPLPGRKEDFGTAKALQDAGGEDQKSVFMYQDAVKRRIQEARMYPDEARKDGTQGSVELSFVIFSDGNLGDVSLIKSSGTQVLDEEALSTIKRASPFPAYADKVNTGKIDMQVTIVFKLN